MMYLRSLLLVLCATCLSGQSQSSSSNEPLRLIVREVNAGPAGASDPHRALQIDVQNERNSEVLAYVLRIEFYRPDGTPSSATVSRMINYGDPTGGTRTIFAPQKQWRHSKPLFIARSSKDGSLRKYSVTVDYVTFADGFRYGPDKSGLAKDTEGFLRGMAAAKRLQNAQSKPQPQ